MSGVAEIVVGFSITDEEYNDVHTGPITIKTSLADEYDYSKESYYNVVESGVLSAYGWTVDYAKKTELYNKNNVKISSPILISNEDGEKMLLLEVENNLEMGIHVITRNISANGVTLYDSLWSSSTINAGKKYVLGLKLSSMLDETTLEEQGITEIEDVTFSLEMEDENNNTLSLPETVSVSVK